MVDAHRHQLQLTIFDEVFPGILEQMNLLNGDFEAGPLFEGEANSSEVLLDLRYRLRTTDLRLVLQAGAGKSRDTWKLRNYNYCCRRASASTTDPYDLDGLCFSVNMGPPLLGERSIFLLGHKGLISSDEVEPYYPPTKWDDPQTFLECVKLYVLNGQLPITPVASR